VSAATHGFAGGLRLHKPAEFKRAYAEGSRFANGQFTMHACANGSAAPRLGLSIAARVAGNAVQRNRIKRQVRESFRHQQQALGGFDIVVGVRNGVRGIGKSDLRESLAGLWQQVAQACVT
jgi:ribonuclease P protein component